MQAFLKPAINPALMDMLVGAAAFVLTEARSVSGMNRRLEALE